MRQSFFIAQIRQSWARISITYLLLFAVSIIFSIFAAVLSGFSICGYLFALSMLLIVSELFLVFLEILESVVDIQIDVISCK